MSYNIINLFCRPWNNVAAVLLRSRFPKNNMTLLLNEFARFLPSKWIESHSYSPTIERCRNWCLASDSTRSFPLKWLKRYYLTITMVLSINCIRMVFWLNLYFVVWTAALLLQLPFDYLLWKVGHEFLPTYFEVCDRMLNEEHGIMVFQCITMPESRYDAYLRGCDFIQAYIFP